MLKYFGITELVGDINTGKTSVCIEESKKYYTLYITTTNFPIKRLSSPDDTIYIKLVQSLDEIPNNINTVQADFYRIINNR